ncbi:MAG: DUF998 domain-containing protein [Candidatus Hermodarchaeia archaeon]|jgi:hypothetical protein
MNIYQILAICGMLSPIIYTVMWILGGLLRSDYSHIRDDISSLMAVGAPRKRLYDSFLITSSVLLFAFYLGLHGGLNYGLGLIVGPILFIVSGFLGVLVAFFFPLDEGGEILTYKGKMHFTLIVISGLLVIAGMIALYFRLVGVVGWSTFAFYSLVSAVVAVILVSISLVFIKSNYRGLIERFMVGNYMVYYFVLALMVFVTNW